jgi:hypothetical protein
MARWSLIRDMKDPVERRRGGFRTQNSCEHALDPSRCRRGGDGVVQHSPACLLGLGERDMPVAREGRWPHHQ